MTDSSEVHRFEKLADIQKQAFELMNRGDYDSAAEKYRQILDDSLEFEEGDICYQYAYCLEELGEIAEAERYWLMAIIFRGKDPNFYSNYAGFLMDRGRYLEAFQWYLFTIRDTANKNDETPSPWLEQMISCAKDAGYKAQRDPKYIEGVITNLLRPRNVSEI
jgi:tetratricopeptide (TPR) repeat protein